MLKAMLADLFDHNTRVSEDHLSSYVKDVAVIAGVTKGAVADGAVVATEEEKDQPLFPGYRQQRTAVNALSFMYRHSLQPLRNLLYRHIATGVIDQDAVARLSVRQSICLQPVYLAW